MQAALGLRQLELLDEILEARRLRAACYREALERIPYIEAPFEPDYAERAWQSYAARLLPGAPIGRTELMRRLLRDGIATRRGVTAIHEEPAYAGGGEALPNTEAAARESLMLPLFPGMSDEQQSYVIERLGVHMGALEAEPRRLVA
jgi:perosamine synthetase